MVRVITQDTFDAVVKENMEDLEMGRKEAVEDARKQFAAQVRQDQRVIRLIRIL